MYIILYRYVVVVALIAIFRCVYFLYIFFFIDLTTFYIIMNSDTDCKNKKLKTKIIICKQVVYLISV